MELTLAVNRYSISKALLAKACVITGSADAMGEKWLR
jgi:hypothetical protein